MVSFLPSCKVVFIPKDSSMVMPCARRTLSLMASFANSMAFLREILGSLMSSSSIFFFCSRGFRFIGIESSSISKTLRLFLVCVVGSSRLSKVAPCASNFCFFSFSNSATTSSICFCTRGKSCGRILSMSIPFSTRR